MLSIKPLRSSTPGWAARCQPGPDVAGGLRGSRRRDRNHRAYTDFLTDTGLMSQLDGLTATLAYDEPEKLELRPPTSAT